MNDKVWRLPWEDELVPHAVLDILRECNISCRACYNHCPPSGPKSLEAIEQELDTLMSLRRLSSVSIVGGEVALHPQLSDIIKMVRSRGLQAELVTNGLAMGEQLLRALAEAGLSVVYFHIEKGQKRSDLPEGFSFSEINNLREKKAAMATRYGLDVGLTLTVYPGEMDELDNTLSFVLQSRHINYLLITLFRDNSTIKALQGDIRTGISGEGGPPPKGTSRSLTEFASYLKNRFGLDPFAFIGSNVYPDIPRWLSYLVVAIQNPDDSSAYQSLQISLLEKLAMFYYRSIKRQYPMYIEQNIKQIRGQLTVNGLLTGNYSKYKPLITNSKKQGAHLSAKRILFQNPAELTKEGKLLHCHHCPDVVIKNGSLVPVCVADKVKSNHSASHPAPPHRSGRAELPHRAPRLYSLPQKTANN